MHNAGQVVQCECITHQLTDTQLYFLSEMLTGLHVRSDRLSDGDRGVVLEAALWISSTKMGL